MVFPGSLSDSMSPQVSRTLLNILADLNNEAIWLFSTRPLISESSWHFINHLVTVLKSPITIRIIVTFIFHNSFSSPARSRYLSFFSLSFNFTLWSETTATSTILDALFFIIQGLDVWPRIGDQSVS